MNEIERLEQWMKTNNFNPPQLAKEIGMSMDGVYQILHRRRVSAGFKLRFQARFGVKVASELFDAPEVAEPA